MTQKFPCLTISGETSVTNTGPIREANWGVRTSSNERSSDLIDLKP